MLYLDVYTQAVFLERNALSSCIDAILTTMPNVASLKIGALGSAPPQRGGLYVRTLDLLILSYHKTYLYYAGEEADFSKRNT